MYECRVTVVCWCWGEFDIVIIVTRVRGSLLSLEFVSECFITLSCQASFIHTWHSATAVSVCVWRRWAQSSCSWSRPTPCVSQPFACWTHCCCCCRVTSGLYMYILDLQSIFSTHRHTTVAFILWQDTCCLSNSESFQYLFSNSCKISKISRQAHKKFGLFFSIAAGLVYNTQIIYKT